MRHLPYAVLLVVLFSTGFYYYEQQPDMKEGMIYTLEGGK